MWQTLGHLLSAAWQVHIATLGLIVAGKSFYEALGITMTGASIGVIFPFLLIEIIQWTVRIIGWVYRGTKRLFFWLLWKLLNVKITKTAVAQQVKKEWFWSRWHRHSVAWMAHHRYSKAVIILAVIVPLPGSEYAAVAAARYTKMEHSFSIIFTANLIRTFLVVWLVYFIGGKL